MTKVFTSGKEVFISYAWTDIGFARDLNDALHELKREAWIDLCSIPDSAEWRKEIFAAIEAADNFLFIISPDSLHSSMCGQEVARAVASKKRILTVLYHEVDTREMFPGLGEIQWISYPQLGLKETIRNLIKAIDTDLEWVRKHTRLGLRAAQWEARGSDNGFLLHGAELREAVRWLEQASVKTNCKPSALHQQYIRASKELESLQIERLIDLNEEKEWESARELRTLRGHSGCVYGVALNRAGGLVLSASEDKTLKVWEAESGRELRTLQGHTAEVYGVALSGDGGLAVSASGDKTLKVWEVESGCELRTLRGHTAEVYGVALSEDGGLAISASADKTLKVWEVKSGRDLRTLTGHSDWVFGVALSADGGLAVSASGDKTLKVWGVESGRELRTLRGHFDWVWGVALSRDGGRAVSASYDDTLKVWEVESGRELRTLAGHFDAVSGVAMSGDGRLAVSASSDNTLKVWEVENGHELISLAAHNLPVSTVAWSADGRMLLSGGKSRIIQIYAIDIDLMLSLARSRVARNFTPEKRRKYPHRGDVPPIP
jgi:WD40 repeat protein